MPRTVEVLRYDGRLVFLRRAWTTPTDLLVTVEAKGSRKPVSKLFKATERQLEVAELEPGGEYRIRIETSARAQRIIRRPRTRDLVATEKPPRAVVIGSGRCGTTSVARFLDGLHTCSGNAVACRHETLYEYLLPEVAAARYDAAVDIFRGFWHDVEAAPHLCRLARELPTSHVIHLVRDGRRVVQSGLNRGWYRRGDIWDTIKPPFEGSDFEKCCKFWLYQVTEAERAATLTLRLEDLTSSAEAIRQLLTSLDIAPTSRLFPKENVGKSPSSIDHWSTRQTEAFEEICGEAMDQFYPGWRKSHK